MMFLTNKQIMHKLASRHERMPDIGATKYEKSPITGCHYMRWRYGAMDYKAIYAVRPSAAAACLVIEKTNCETEAFERVIISLDLDAGELEAPLTWDAAESIWAGYALGESCGEPFQRVGIMGQAAINREMDAAVC